MILGKLGSEVSEDFSVTDPNNDLVSGIDSTAFTYNIFNPSGTEVSATVPITITELGSGHYRSKYTPNVVGTWMIVVYHVTYFKWGKTGTVQVFANDFDTIADLAIRILGLVQENFYIDETTYDAGDNMTAGRIRIYSDAASVGTVNNVISTYTVTASYTDNKMQTYKVEKI